MSHHLRKLDVFGAEVSLKYEGQNKYTSRIGGVTSFIIGCLLLALLYQQCSQVYSKSSPNIFYQQTYVDNPSRFDISPDRFSFMIALYNAEKVPVIDQTIYTIEAEFVFKTLVQTNNTYSYNLEAVPISLGPCTIEDFQMVQVQPYFLAQDYTNMYCMKNQSSLYLQGQFDKNQFSTIVISMKECNNELNCKSAEERQQFIKTSQVQVYFTNKILQLENFQQPFTAVGKSQYYDIFYDYLLQTDFIFSNTHVIDDSGLVLATAETTTDLLFVEDRYQLSSKSDNSFFLSYIYLDKGKEDSYYRSYKKIPEVLSQIGGIFQVMLLVGSLFIKPYNALMLRKQLVKDIFSEQNEKENNQDKNANKQQKNKKKKQLNSKVKITEENSSEIFPKRTVTVYQNNEESQSPSTQKEIKSSLIQRVKDALFKQEDDITKRQQIQLESMRSLKMIINTQIQFHLLKSLFYNSDLSSSKVNQLTQVFESVKQNLKSHSELLNKQDNNLTMFNSQSCSPYLKKHLNPSINGSFLLNLNQSISRQDKSPHLSNNSPLNVTCAQGESFENNKNNFYVSADEVKIEAEQCQCYDQQMKQKHPMQIKKIQSERMVGGGDKNVQEDSLIIDQDFEANESPIGYEAECYTHAFNTIKSIKQQHKTKIQQKQGIQTDQQINYNNTQ